MCFYNEILYSKLYKSYFWHVSFLFSATPESFVIGSDEDFLLVVVVIVVIVSVVIDVVVGGGISSLM